MLWTSVNPIIWTYLLLPIIIEDSSYLSCWHVSPFLQRVLCSWFLPFSRQVHHILSHFWMPSLSRSISSYLISQFKDFPIIFNIYCLSIFLINISYQSCNQWLGLRAVPALWAQAIRVRLACWMQRLKAGHCAATLPTCRTCVRCFPWTHGFDVTEDFPGLGDYDGFLKKHRFLRTCVLAFTSWIGFTRSFEAVEWNSSIHNDMYMVLSQAAETAVTGLTI